MVNFGQLNSQSKQPAVIEPRQLFQNLPRGTQFEYLRDVQGDVLDEWFLRRRERDLVIKMNTGSGKTLVGLVLLWSRLKEGAGPALYLCPNRHLVPFLDIFDKYKRQDSLVHDPMRRMCEDMPALKYKVELNESERTRLKQIASRGEASVRKLKRALVLLKADEGLSDRDIANGLLISASTVGRVRTRFVKDGLDSALNERPRPGQKRKLDGRQQAHLIAVACSDAPEGHADWTLQLLADKVVAMGFAESISLETVRQILKKTNSSHGRRGSGASPR